MWQIRIRRCHVSNRTGVLWHLPGEIATGKGRDMNVRSDPTDVAQLTGCVCSGARQAKLRRPLYCRTSMLSRAAFVRSSKVERSRVCMVHAQIQLRRELTKDAENPLLHSFAKRLDVYRRSDFPVIPGQVQKNLLVTR